MYSACPRTNAIFSAWHKSASQYQQTVASTGLESLLNQFDADYRSLGRTLGVA